MANTHTANQVSTPTQQVTATPLALPKDDLGVQLRIFSLGTGSADGSSSILERIQGGSCEIMSSTIGAAYKRLKLAKQDIDTVIWDYPGNLFFGSRGPSTGPMYIKGADIVLLCHGVDSKLDRIEHCVKAIKSVVHHIPILLVGNKMDLRNGGFSSASYEETMQAAKNAGCAGYLECSALTGEGVETIFEAAARIVFEQKIMHLSRFITREQFPPNPPIPLLPLVVSPAGAVTTATPVESKASVVKQDKTAFTPPPPIKPFISQPTKTASIVEPVSNARLPDPKPYVAIQPMKEAPLVLAKDAKGVQLEIFSVSTDSANGSTSILGRQQGRWSSNECITLGPSYGIFKFVKPAIVTKIWDAGSTGIFRMRYEFGDMEGADVVLLCHSVDSKLEYIGFCVEKIKTYHPHMPILLVGNKMDLRGRTDLTPWLHSYDAILDVGKITGCVGYLECSALTGEGVETIFEAAARIVYEQRAKHHLQFITREQFPPNPPALPAPVVSTTGVVTTPPPIKPVVSQPKKISSIVEPVSNARLPDPKPYVAIQPMKEVPLVLAKDANGIQFKICSVSTQSANGSSSLLMRQLGKWDDWSKNACGTIGAAYFTFKFGKQDVFTGFWDTTSQDRFASSFEPLLSGKDIAIICHSVDSKLEYIESSVKKIRNHSHHIPILLVTNKIDLRGRTGLTIGPFSYEEILKVAKETGCAGYLECSALTGEGVETIFEAAARIVFEQKVLHLSRFITREEFPPCAPIDLPQTVITPKPSVTITVPKVDTSTADNPTSDAKLHLVEQESVVAPIKVNEEPPAISISPPTLDVTVVVKPATAPSAEFMIWLDELRNAGFKASSLQAFSQEIMLWNEAGISLKSMKQAVNKIQLYLIQFGSHLALINKEFELEPAAQAEQAYINRDTKLANYCHKLQQELSKFIVAYFLATSGIFKLEDNKKGMILNAIGDAPFIGSFLKVFTAGLQYANHKYSAYQVNRLTKLFTKIDLIERTILRFCRQLTLAKEKEIQGQITLIPSGITGKLRGFYEDIKETLYQQRHDLKVSDSTGLTLKAEEKLALLDGAYLIEQVLSDDVKADEQNLNVVPRFLKIVLKNPNYQHQTAAHVFVNPPDTMTLAGVPPISATVSQFANPASAVTHCNDSPMSSAPHVGTPSHNAADLKSALSVEHKKTVVAGLQAAFVKKGITNTGEKEAAARAEKFNAPPAALNPAPLALLTNRARIERQQQEAKRFLQSELVTQSANKQAKIEETRLQLRAYLSQCLQEQKYFEKQKYTPELYFKLAFPLRLHELFIRSYLVRFDSKMNYPDDATAVTDVEIRSFNRIMGYACPRAENLQNFIEMLSPLFTRGIAAIYPDQLTDCKTYAAVNLLMQTYLKQLRGSLLKTISNTPKLDSKLFDTLSKCADYILNCFIDHSDESQNAKVKAKEKIKLYFETCDEKVKNISFSLGVQLPNGAIFFTGRPCHSQAMVDIKTAQKPTESSKVVLELTVEQADKLKKMLNLELEKENNRTNCLIM